MIINLVPNRSNPSLKCFVHHLLRHGFSLRENQEYFLIHNSPASFGVIDNKPWHGRWVFLLNLIVILFNILRKKYGGIGACNKELPSFIIHLKLILSFQLLYLLMYPQRIPSHLNYVSYLYFLIQTPFIIKFIQINRAICSISKIKLICMYQTTR